MAHIGRQYKLLFRRDICLGCVNYRHAFPEAFLISYRLRSGPPENLEWHHSRLLLPAIDPPETARPRWESIDLFQHDVSFRITAEFDGYTPAQQLTNMIIRWHTGSNYFTEVLPAQRLVGRCGVYDYDVFGAGSATVLEPTIWGGADAAGQCFLTPAMWQDYPP